MAHAEFAPSAAHRWLNCPGSVALSRGMPDESSLAAREGTFAHEIAARVLTDNLDRARELIGETDGEFTCDETMADHVQTYVDVVRSLVAERTKPKLFVEQSVFALNGVFGTADAVVAGNGKLDVVDFKYGAGIAVEVEENPQLMLYGWGAHRLAKPDGMSMFEETRLHIVQPRRPEIGHQTWIVKTAKLESWVTHHVKSQRERAKDENAPRTPGDWCRFCPARVKCPELQRERASVFTAVEPDLETGLAPARYDIDPSKLTEDQIGQLLDLFPRVEEWMGRVRAEAETRMLVGHRVPGRKLVRKTTHRKWRDEETAALLLSQLVDNPTKLYKLQTPAQVSKVLGPQWSEVEGALVEQPEGALTVASKDDRRKEVIVAKFEAIEPPGDRPASK
jgi:hypothetical protein